MSKFRMTLVCTGFFLAGALANTWLAPEEARAQVQSDRVYKVVDIDYELYTLPGRNAEFAAELNAAAQGGWRMVPLKLGSGAIVFEKR